jgi:hypothetical protein
MAALRESEWTTSLDNFPPSVAQQLTDDGPTVY